MNYQCSECHRPIGLMANQQGRPTLFKCPHTGRVALPQMAVHRDTPPLPGPVAAEQKPKPKVVVRDDSVR